MRTIVALTGLLAVAGLASAEDKAPAKKDALAHVVFFTLKEGTDEGKIDELIADCHKMLGKIKAVRGVKAGRPTKEKAEKFVVTGYHVGLVVLVDDYEGLKAYHVDPLHKEFAEKYVKLFDLEKLKVFDFTDGK